MSTVFEKRLATLAQVQFDKYRWLRENQDPLASQIKTHWTELGLAFPNVAQPWSAVFVSWCVKQAGATAAQFMCSPQHSQFVHAAIFNAKAHAKGDANAAPGAFMGRDVGQYAPKMGDILQKKRKVTAHRQIPQHNHLLGRRTDDHPVAVLDIQAQQGIAYGTTHQVNLHVASVGSATARSQRTRR